MALAEAGRHDDALAYFESTIGPLGVSLSKATSEWIEHNRQVGSRAAGAALDAIEQTRTQIVAADLIALLLTALLGVVTFRRLVNPIQALERSVKPIAAGDYTEIRSVYRRQRRDGQPGPIDRGAQAGRRGDR